MVTKEDAFPPGVIGSDKFRTDLTRLFGDFLPYDIGGKTWKAGRNVDENMKEYFLLENKGRLGAVEYFDKITLEPTTGKIKRVQSTISEWNHTRRLMRDVFTLTVSSQHNVFSKPNLFINSVFQSLDTMTIPWGTINPYEPEKYSDHTHLELLIQTKKNIFRNPTPEHSINVKYSSAKENQETTIVSEGPFMTVVHNHGIPLTSEITQLNRPDGSQVDLAISITTEDIATRFHDLWGVKLFTPPDILAQKLMKSTINSMKQPSFTFQPSSGISGV